MKISGNLIDIHSRSIFPASITVEEGTIRSVERTNSAGDLFIMPGLIDSHIHIESSMVTPGAFAGAAIKQGTTAVVSDPHEIANVMGLEGVRFMIREGNSTPLKFNFGAPSCVPATAFEESGAYLGPKEIDELMSGSDIKYLSEMMNFPGVIHGDSEVIEKIKIAEKYNKPVDGHAPGLSGKDLKKYVSAGISTDHECSTLQEALEKISTGMKILIREGSAARNMDALKELFKINPGALMLCTDDLHPEMLRKGHINRLIASLVSQGYDIFDVIRSATVNPVGHYKLNSGLLRPGDPADFIIADSPEKMNVLETWIDGHRVYSRDELMFRYIPGEVMNNFNCSAISAEDLLIKNRGKFIRVIEAFDGELVTKEVLTETRGSIYAGPDLKDDILKIVVKDRYKDGPVASGFITGFGLKRGAFASSVAHDSHNIIAVGTNDRDIVNAVNRIVDLKGGLAVSGEEGIKSLSLNVGGIMSNRPCSEVATDYLGLSEEVRKSGCVMSAPFMTLSFMALLVIPELKLSDKGLFDGRKFAPVSLFVD